MIIRKPAFVRRWVQHARRAATTRPGFLVIGAQKAGTTSLYNYLLAHPSLQGPLTQKEIHYFNIYYHKGLDWYLSNFPRRSIGSRAICFEATPDYLCHPMAAERIRDQIGELRLIAVLRDPAQRAYSAWNMWHHSMTSPEKRHKTDHRTFAEAIEDELVSTDREQNAPYYYLDMGMYADHVQRFWSLFPREKLLLLNYDAMGKDLQRFLNAICEFLKIPLFSSDVVAEMKERRFWTGKKTQRSSEELEVIERLNEFYAPHNRRLAEMTGIEFACN